MIARTAVETIQAAIEKLEALKAKSTPGEWFLTYERATYARIWGNQDDEDADHVATVERTSHDAELIITLHRTIDAQLAILRGDIHLHGRYEAAGRSSEWLVAIERAGDLALARAILGEES